MTEEKNECVPRLRFPEFVGKKWQIFSLGEVAIFYNGRAYKKEELLANGKYKILRVGNLFSNENWYYSNLELEEEKYCNYNDLLYAWSASFGPFIWHSEKTIYHYHIWKIIPNNKIEKMFLYYILVLETEKIKNNMLNGLGIMHVTKSSIESWNSQIPTLPEQQKIADCLSSLDELIEAREQKCNALKQHKKGLMQRLFPAEGETTPRWRFPEFWKTHGWQPHTIGKICETFSGATPATSKKEYYGGDIPFIRSAEINNTSTELFISDAGLKNSSAKIVHKGDILLALYGANSGELAISKIDGAINQAILCLRSKENNIFIFYFLCSKMNYIVSKYLQGGQGNLSAEIIKSIVIYLPVDQKEQQKIADCLSSLDDRIAAEEERLTALREHKKGLMQQLFPVI